MVLTLAFYTAGVLVMVGVGLYVVGAYNQVVSSTQDVERAFANIEVSLKQRHDEIPRLVETCRGYMAHERRTAGSSGDRRCDVVVRRPSRWFPQ